MIKSIDRQPADIGQRLKDLRQVEAVLKRAARQAVLDHARAGLKIAVWREGQVAWVEPIAELDQSQVTNDK